MSIKKFFRFGKSKSDSAVQIDTVNGPSVVVGDVDQAMVSQDSAIKILAVQDGDHSTALVDYAIKMAKKIDCEILALDVSEEPLNFSGERKEREIQRFQQRATSNAETFQLKAEAMGVICKHMTQIGKQEEMIKTLSQGDKSIRYVLLKPAQEPVAVDSRLPRIPVVDLNCSSL